MAKSDSTVYLKMLNDNQNCDSEHERFLLLSSAYLAPVSYFQLMVGNDSAVKIEKYEYYQKQSYRNRCRIATANGVMDLTIPVEKPDKQLIRDVRISSHGDWQTQHWRTIEAAYNSSPFFEYYSDDLRPFFEKKWVFLWEFNQIIQEKILDLIDGGINICTTDCYIEKYNKNVTDLRNKIHPKKDSPIRLMSYYQVFEQKNGFIPDLSIIDLLFNMGNESQLILNERPEFV